jgi:chromosome segregation ATPase
MIKSTGNSFLLAPELVLLLIKNIEDRIKSLDENQNNIKTNNKNITEVKTDISTLEQDKINLQLIIDKLTADANINDQRLIQLTNEITKKKLKIKAARKKLNNFLKIKGQANATELALSNELKIATVELENAKKQIDSLQDTLTKGTDSHKKVVESLELRIKTEGTLLAALKSGHSILEKKENDLQILTNQQRSEINALKVQISSCEKNLSDKQSELSKLNSNFLQLKQDHDQTKSNLIQVISEKNEISKEKMQALIENKKLKEDMNTLKVKKEKLLQEYAKINDNLQAYLKKTTENAIYNLDQERNKPKINPETDIVFSKEEYNKKESDRLKETEKFIAEHEKIEKKLKDEIKDCLSKQTQNENRINELAKKEIELTKIINTLNNESKELKNRNNELLQTNNDNLLLISNFQPKEDHLKFIEDETARLKKENYDLVSMQNINSQELINFKKAYNDLLEKYTVLKSKIKELEEKEIDCNKLRNEIKILKEELKKAELTAQEYSKFKKKFNDMEKLKEKAYKELLEKDTALKSKIKELDEKEIYCNKLQNEIKNTKGELKNAELTVQEYSEFKKKFNDMEKSLKEKEQYKIKFEKLQSTIQFKTKLFETNAKECNELKNKIIDMEKSLKEKEELITKNNKIIVQFEQLQSLAKLKTEATKNSVKESTLDLIAFFEEQLKKYTNIAALNHNLTTKNNELEQKNKAFEQILTDLNNEKQQIERQLQTAQTQNLVPRDLERQITFASKDLMEKNSALEAQISKLRMDNMGLNVVTSEYTRLKELNDNLTRNNITLTSELETKDEKIQALTKNIKKKEEKIDELSAQNDQLYIQLENSIKSGKLVIEEVKRDPYGNVQGNDPNSMLAKLSDLYKGILKKTS